MFLLDVLKCRYGMILLNEWEHTDDPDLRRPYAHSTTHVGYDSQEVITVTIYLKNHCVRARFDAEDPSIITMKKGPRNTINRHGGFTFINAEDVNVDLRDPDSLRQLDAVLGLPPR